jgi:hypothetical protein
MTPLRGLGHGGLKDVVPAPLALAVNAAIGRVLEIHRRQSC